jgi:predicted DNA-binding ribbon-helix-helix protein
MLVSRNINVDRHRTSIRLEPEFWTAFADIAKRENVTMNELCTEIDGGAGELSRSAAIRIFIASYMVRLSELDSEQIQDSITALASDRSEVESSGDYPVPPSTITPLDKSGEINEIKDRTHKKTTNSNMSMIDRDPNQLLLNELPLPSAKHWIAQDKAAVVAAVKNGAITLDEACQRYNLSVEEYLSWEERIEKHGVLGLRVGKLRDFRAA